MTGEIIRYRMRVLAVVALSMFLVLTARLWYLQALKSDEARDVATTNITRVINIEAPRGQIYDSSGKLLVGNRIVASVTLNPKEIEEFHEETIYRTIIKYCNFNSLFCCDDCANNYYYKNLSCKSC